MMMVISIIVYSWLITCICRYLHLAVGYDAYLSVFANSGPLSFCSSVVVQKDVVLWIVLLELCYLFAYDLVFFSLPTTVHVT